LQGYLIPVGELPGRVNELEEVRQAGQEIVVHCKSGGRSQKAAEFLQQQGFKNVANVAGGILAWAGEIDPSVPKY
jgi:adenylyltransferase/sulfurtransferase